MLAGNQLCQTDGSLVGFCPGGQEQHLFQTGHKRSEALRKVDDRAGQHAAEQVVELADLLAHGAYDIRMGMPQDGTHLTGREIEDWCA